MGGRDAVLRAPNPRCLHFFARLAFAAGFTIRWLAAGVDEAKKVSRHLIGHLPARHVLNGKLQLDSVHLQSLQHCFNSKAAVDVLTVDLAMMPGQKERSNSLKLRSAENDCRKNRTDLDVFYRDAGQVAVGKIRFKINPVVQLIGFEPIQDLFHSLILINEPVLRPVVKVDVMKH